VPVYNTEEYLSESLASITAQTLHDIEIICINDGSTDGSAEIIHRHAALDSRIIVIEQKNMGASAAKNAGLKSASGDFLVFIDSDDALPPSALAALHAAAEAVGVDIVHGGHVTENEMAGRWQRHKIPHQTLEADEPFVAVLSGSLPRDPWAKLFRRSLFTDHDLSFPENVRCATDLLIVNQAYFFARKVQLISDTVYHRRLRVGSLTTDFASEFYIRDRIRARKALASFVRDQGVWGQYRDILSKNNWRFFRGFLLHRMIWLAKGKNCHSIAAIADECNSGLPEFSATEDVVAWTVIQCLANPSNEVREMNSDDMASVGRYVADYLFTVPREKLTTDQTGVIDLLCISEPENIDWAAIASGYRQINLPGSGK